jgi:4-hydroxy-tetrahydrodipicolinate reductase
LSNKSSLNIALFGYGKMGKLVEKAALRNNHTIAKIITSSSKDFDQLKEVDVCIDFSSADGVLANVEQAARLGKNIVIGTTGWQSDLDQARAIAEKYQTGILFSPNFSIGVHLFLKIVEEASKRIAKSGGYDVAGVELHHNQKKMLLQELL